MKYYQDNSAKEAVKIAEKMKNENKTFKEVIKELLKANGAHKDTITRFESAFNNEQAVEMLSKLAEFYKKK